jgi:hypothetical protein
MHASFFSTMAAFAAGVLLIESNCSAVIYDAAADFSLTANPAGVWSCGYSTTLGGAFTLNGEVYADSSGLYLWRKTGSGQNGPAFVYNPTANPIIITGPSDLAVWNPYQLSSSPGSVGMEYSVLRFTAPGTGQYRVAGAFSSVDRYFGATTDVHVLKNNSSLHDGTVMGITSVSSFDQVILLNAGDWLDFVVGVGSYGGGWDSTGLDARVTPIPEPASMGLFGLGLLIAVSASRSSVASICSLVLDGAAFGRNQTSSREAAKPRSF